MPSQTQGAAGPRSTLRARAGELRLAEWLLLALFAICFAAAATGGGIALTPSGRLEVAIAALGLAAALGVSLGAVPVPRAPLAWSGVGLLFAYAVWSALSINWSIEPDASWLAANRTLAYALVGGPVLIAASATRAASERIAVGVGMLGLAIALFALAGKLLPGIDIGPLDLDFGGRFSRLSHPFDYWNALALMCVIGAAPFIWLSADPQRRTERRVLALLALELVLLTMVLTYSRGAIFSFAAMLAVMVAAGPNRLGRLGAAGGALAAMLPAIAVAFTNHDLSADNLPLSERIDGGLVLLAVLAACLVASAWVAREVLRRTEGRELGKAERRRVWRGLGAAVGALAVIGLVALALSSRGLTGEITHQVDQFQHPGSS